MTGLSVPCPVAVRVSVSLMAEHRCPFKPERDYGTAEVSWVTSRGETVELHALAWLARRDADLEISHEQWTSDLYGAIAAAVGVDELSVTSKWMTAGTSVAVHVGADRPEHPLASGDGGR